MRFYAVAAMCLAAGVARAAPAVVVADFDFADTSGEVVDQSAAHDARVRQFGQALRRDLAGGGRFVVVQLACGQSVCSADQLSADDLTRDAKSSGARYLVFGGFHKMSSLILNGTVLVVDLPTDKVVLNRLLTFRGDTDEAWQKMESFVFAEIDRLGSGAPAK